jgi:hypothetical protein
MNSIFYIEKATGKVLWKMGGSGPSSCLDSPSPVYVPVTDPFIGQHDARFQPDWKPTKSGYSGHVSLFDDETYTGNAARGAVYNVQVDLASGGSDGGAGGASAASRVWDYANSYDRLPSNTCGSFRISADGSRIIDWGQSQPGGGMVLFTEVDEKGNDLLDLICPDGSSSYRAVKVPLSAFELSVLRRTCGT